MEMDFNLSKCEVLHLGRPDVRGKYILTGKTLNNIDVQKDRMFKVHSSMKVATQVNIVIKKANMLAFIGAV